ncbi:unnamed protein product [Gongylonema pulchrum]|uniref:Ubiquitin-like domain-containing protein n=1 Tax=Gongylonema pulchrum TaxID=637853 RepID=A0A183EDR9_9BILA|nr:unnamed protein product [Gongylonema pulchrum]
MFASSVFARAWQQLRSYGDYVRKVRAMKSFLGRMSHAEDVHSLTKFIVTFDDYPLMMKNSGAYQLNLRTVSYAEIVEKLQQEVGVLKQKCILLDMVNCPEHNCYVPVCGLPLQRSDVPLTVSVENYCEELENRLTGRFFSPRLAVTMLKCDLERSLIATVNYFAMIYISFTRILIQI